MKVNFEYGTGMMSAELPDHLTDVFIPGITTSDPVCISRNRLVKRTRESILHPVGMPPLSELADRESTVTIIISDIITGGCHPTSHRKLAVKLILEELYKAGVEKKNILLIFSNGLHPRTSKKEMQQILGDEIFHAFYSTHQIISHDSEDHEHMVDLGCTERGDRVLMNKYVYDSDIAVMIGHTQGIPYGGYTGGYKHCAAGITHWRSLAAHCIPKSVLEGVHAPAMDRSPLISKFDEIGMHMEKCMGKKFFCCDAVLDSICRQIEINSGYAKEMQPVSWCTADKRTYVHWAEKKYDVMVFGMPQDFYYGDGMGTNPIQMMQALSAQIVLHKRVMSDICVILCSSICNGYFHDQRWPYLREIYELYQHDHMNILPDMEKYEEYFATNEEYVRKYRFAGAFHPYHGFSMMQCGHIAEMNTSAIYIVGAQEPGIARGMGLKTRATFEEALEDAMKKYVGREPNILALPLAFKREPVRLCMKEALGD